MGFCDEGSFGRYGSWVGRLDWSRPFWKAYFDKTLDVFDLDIFDYDQESLFEAAATYAQMYGLVEEYSVEYMSQLLTGE